MSKKRTPVIISCPESVAKKSRDRFSYDAGRAYRKNRCIVLINGKEDKAATQMLHSSATRMFKRLFDIVAFDGETSHRDWAEYMYPRDFKLHKLNVAQLEISKNKQDTSK